MTANAIETAEEKVREGAETAVSETRDTARKAGSQARSTLRDQADRRSSQMGERVKDFAGDFHSTAEELRKQGKDQPAEMIEQVAGRADDLGDYLKRADGEQMLEDIERFGRERPWAIAATGFAIGLAVSRMLKASSADRYDRAVGQRPRYNSTQGIAPPQQRDFNGMTRSEQILREQELAAGGPPLAGG